MRKYEIYVYYPSMKLEQVVTYYGDDNPKKAQRAYINKMKGKEPFKIRKIK